VLGREFVAIFLPDCFEGFGVGFAVLEPAIEVGVLADALEEFGDEGGVVFGHELPEGLAGGGGGDEATGNSDDTHGISDGEGTGVEDEKLVPGWDRS
jgi:hypothetical protein